MAWELTYAELADRGVLLDLNTMLALDRAFAAELKAGSISSLYETFTFNDGQYAFPEQWSGNFLFSSPRPACSCHREFLDTAEALTKHHESGRVA